MALRESNRRNATFLAIIDGSIVTKSKEPREGFEHYMDGQGNESYIKRFPGFDGYIDDITWFDREITGGKRIKGWTLHITDQGENYELSISNKSPVCSVFMNVAGNIDFNKKVDFSVWKDREGKTAFVLRQPNQSGEVVRRCHTRDNPNGMPEAKQRKSGEWDFSDVEDFLMEKMDKEIIPVCRRAAEARKNTVAVAVAAAGSHYDDDFAPADLDPKGAGADDDIPF
jgi:hypothetical protein